MLTGKMADIAAGIYDLGAVKVDTEKGFALKHHEKEPLTPYSPILFNLRTPENPKPGPLTPEMVEMIGETLFDLVCGVTRMIPKAICGIPRAGEPFADAIERCFAKIAPGHAPTQIRLAKKEEDGKRTIIAPTEGWVEHRGTTLLFDDLITKADSKMEAVWALDAAGFTVKDIFVFIDREQGGPFTLIKNGINLHHVTTASEIIAWGRDNGRISAADAEFCIGYIRGDNAGVPH